LNRRRLRVESREEKMERRERRMREEFKPTNLGYH